MSNEIQLVYTATRALVLPARLNTEQTLTITVSSNEPPRPRLTGRTQHSRRGLRKATTIHGRWYQGTLACPYISAAERPYWREYMESTAEEEPHQMLHDAFPGWDGDLEDLTIYRPLNSGSLSRFQMEDAYTASIEWRQVE